ncbi:MAG: response regulator transcription factor [Magnetococcales bacterium]|nr:response regulator transcription factor [Magnetococcales bacterium]
MINDALGDDAPLILIVEDEQDVVTPMEIKLKLEGYQTRSALTGKSALTEVFREPIPDLILLDIMLPDISGLDVCMRIREAPQTSQIPIIMLTAKGEEIDRVVGFEVGADDYLVKPFSIRELVLRIKVALKRTMGTNVEQPRKSTFGSLNINYDTHRVYVDEEEVLLTATEFKLLSTFIERAGRVQTRDILLDVVWGVQSYVQTRTVDSHIKQLRKKLGPAGDFFETVRGVGYLFNAPSGNRVV